METHPTHDDDDMSDAELAEHRAAELAAPRVSLIAVSNAYRFGLTLARRHAVTPSIIDATNSILSTCRYVTNLETQARAEGDEIGAAKYEGYAWASGRIDPTASQRLFTEEEVTEAMRRADAVADAAVILGL